jgi:acyl carrier protein
MQRRLRLKEMMKGSLSMTVGELKSVLDATSTAPGLNELLKRCAQPAYRAETAWSSTGADGQCDVLFHPVGDPERGVPLHAPASRKPLEDFANNPFLAKTRHELIPELREFLKTQLPDYMVPGAWMLLEKLPRTPNGKVDRQSLPEPEASGIARDLFIAPRTPAETSIAGIWRDLLRVQQVGINDNFFELGGHSLLVTQVVSRLRDMFQVDVPLRCLFERPTVAATAATVEDLLVAQVQELSEEEAQQLTNTAP